MNRFWKWTAGIFSVLLVAAFAVLSYLAGSPKDAYGMVRYALPHMHLGTLKVGSDAPDARIVALEQSPAPLLVARGDDHPGAEPREPDRGLLPDPGVPTRDHHDFAGHLRHDRQRYPWPPIR